MCVFFVILRMGDFGSQDSWGTRDIGICFRYGEIGRSGNPQTCNFEGSASHNQQHWSSGSLKFDILQHCPISVCFYSFNCRPNKLFSLQASLNPMQAKFRSHQILEIGSVRMCYDTENEHRRADKKRTTPTVNAPFRR